MTINHLSFAGYLQPPTVPPDPTGDSWRGPQGVAGPPGPAGPPGTVTAAVLPTSPGPPGSGVWWSNGGYVMTS